MLRVTIPETTLFNNKTNKFIHIQETTLELEHSLISLSKWEQKWHIRFLSPSTKLTQEQSLDYIKCMTITRNVDPNVYLGIPNDVMKQITDYIQDPMTATNFSEKHGHNASHGEEVSSELIYYWMTAYQIPWEAEKWHLNRLMTLIRIANLKNQPSKKMSKSDILKQNKALNASRRARMHSKG